MTPKMPKDILDNPFLDDELLDDIVPWTDEEDDEDLSDVGDFEIDRDSDDYLEPESELPF